MTKEADFLGTLTDEQLTALVSFLNDSPTFLHGRALAELVSRDDREHGYKCRHTNATEPRYSGGNYGYYGFQTCKDCDASRDDYSNWS